MSVMVEIYPTDGPDAFTTSSSTFPGQVAVPRVGDLVHLAKITYLVEHVAWIYGAKLDPPRVVVRVRLAFPHRLKWRIWQILRSTPPTKPVDPRMRGNDEQA